MVQTRGGPRIIMKGGLKISVLGMLLLGFKNIQVNGDNGVGTQDLIQILNLLQHCSEKNPFIRGIG